MQTELVAELLRAAHPGSVRRVTTITISTAGDRDQTSALSAGEGIGWFTSAIQQALQAGDIDIAVHSYKDLPTSRPDGLIIAAVPLREDPRDALVSASGATFRGLKPGSTVGTSSARREAQLRAIRRPRNPADPRERGHARRKVDAGEFDAAVLAYAGLKRLGIAERVSHVFGFEELLPAPAQGALAIECRTADAETRALLTAIDDQPLRQLVTAERMFLATLEAGCSFPRPPTRSISVAR